ncbi:MAG: hypothetical protein L6266_00460, partial [Nanoarchaeota archaeon]|nr:hypothetical protein [Nanoarchaeota archaeon]
YGVLDGKNSPERGKEEKEIKVFVGDIPPDPEIKDFKIITEGNEDLTDISAIPNSKSKWQIIKGKTFELKWDVENDEYGDENGSPLSIDIFSQTGIEKSKFVASSKIKNNENEPLLIDTSSFETGIYTFTIKVNNDEFPASDNGLEEATFEPIKISVKDLRDVLPNPEINDFEIVEDNKDLIPMPVDSTTEWQIPIGKTFELEWDVKVEYNKYSGPLDISVYLKKGIGDEKLLSSSDIKNNRDNPLKINTSSLRTGTYTFVLRVNNSEFPESEGGPEEAMRKLNILVGNVEDMPLPEVEFSTDKTEIEKDEFATLTWEVADAEKVSIDHNVGNSLSGTANVRPAISTTYTLTAIGFNGASKTKTVRIEIKSASIELPEWEEPEPPPPPPKPFREQEVLPEKDTIDLKVNGVDGPITIESQSKFTLSWNLDKYCLATGSWLKVKLKAGSEDITLKKNGKYTYSLYCPGSGSDTVVVNVVGGTGGDSRSGLIDNLLGRKDKLSEEQMPVAEASISTDQITYSQDITVARGEPTDLYVKVNQDINNDGKTSRDATEGWSSLLTNSGYCLYNIDLARNPAEFKGMVKSPENAKECNVRLGNFTFNNEPGTYRYGIFRLLQNDKKFSNISYVDITVEGPPPPDTAPIINFKIDGNDASEQIIGAPAEYNLIWSVANADSCEASGSWGGEKELEGIQRFVSSVKKNFNYTLTCVGELGTTIKSIALRVVEAPTCSFTALPPTIDKQSAFITDSELSWKCEYAEWCSLEPGVNEEINTYGSIRVSPDQTTTYILTCNNSSVSKSFEAEVIVEE